MFLHALASVFGGILGHFNPLVAGVLLVLGVVLLRPSQGRTEGRTRATDAAHRGTRSAAVILADDEAGEPVHQRAVAGSRQPSSPARRRPPRGGGGMFLLLVGGLPPLT